MCTITISRTRLLLHVDDYKLKHAINTYRRWIANKKVGKSHSIWQGDRNSAKRLRPGREREIDRGGDRETDRHGETETERLKT